MTYPTTRTDDFIRDLNHHRESVVVVDGVERGIAAGDVIEEDGHDWCVVRCPFCRAFYGALCDGGLVGSARDYCENCGEAQP